jgi:hypothetical protein
MGGFCNTINITSSNSSIIGGCCNALSSSNNSVIIGGQCLSVSNQNDFVYLNATTNFRQTVEVTDTTSTISSPTFSISFTDGSVKYISSVSNDFGVSFTNVPLIPNTTMTYTLIINQGNPPYMITGVEINTLPYTIKWSNGVAPVGNADQIDIIGLMFIVDNGGSIAQLLGQLGTFAS